MIKDPKIVQFDGDDNYHTILDLVCFKMELDVVEHAWSQGSADKVFEKIAKGEIKPNIAIISSYLYNDHEDGEKILTKLKAQIPDIFIISYSIIPDLEWGDKNAVKGAEGEKSLISILESISGKKYPLSN